ncbi:spore germination protein [Salirhabdus sp. Marseille-P4669]|uniref:spore germination protein n=1 Tax=Salirhabdus sp. Marseille-P4669 TaxID=2042310 RepID=UPI000C799845|nr:spore germination protein [Salirhabdus sp. Marseille-P4669]
MKLIIRKRQKKKRQKEKQGTTNTSNVPENLQNTFALTIDDNVKAIKETLGNSSDLLSRIFYIGSKQPVKAALLYINGLVDRNYVQESIAETLMIDLRLTEQDETSFRNERASQQEKETDNNVELHLLESDLFTVLKNKSFANSEVKEINTFSQLYNHMLSGDAILLLNGYSKGFAIDAKGYESRSVEEPSSQPVVRGPKEGFSEKIMTNTALIRRRIKDPNLWISMRKIGRKTNTDIAICYINGLVNDDIVQEVNRRLDQIDIDGILESGYIEELIQDETYSPFPTIFNTERPDTICAGLLEGRVAIIVDGTPFALLVPALFVHFFQASEDYYQRFDISSLIRALRYLCFFLALLTPSVYIALTTFHQEMIPTQLLISLAAQREGVPFPAYVEALMMEVTFEILREAGTRMPRAVGNAISIVGALVLGQAAVEAGIVSSAMVIVVSLTAISSFVSPTFNMGIAIRMLRFLFMTISAMFGLVGIILGLILLVMHLSSLRSFGIPYLSPMGPFIQGDQKDALIRVPHWRMKKRPMLTNKKNPTRVNTNPPKPSNNNTKN